LGFGSAAGILSSLLGVVASLLGGLAVSVVVDGAVVLDGLVADGSVAGCCMLPCGDAGSVACGSVLLLVAGAAGVSVVVCADTKPTAPTIVAALIAVTRILEALIVELLGR
jgi:hypothetical protein